jgi:hypothetical protein
MKILLSTLTFLFICNALTAQNEAKNKTPEEALEKLTPKQRLLKYEAKAKEKEQDYKHVIKYVLDPRIEKSEKEIPKIEKKIKFYKDKLRIAKKAKAKKMYREKLLIEERKLQVILLWKHYKKQYIISRQAYNVRDNEKYEKSMLYLAAIRKKYIEITAKTLIDPEAEFYSSEKGKKLLARRLANK